MSSWERGPLARRQRHAGQPAVPGILFRFLLRLPANLLLLLIRLYQRTLSPALPAIFGSACGCRFSPTCSHYAAGAIRAHGALAGSILAAIRLVKCTPLHPGGMDPVPARFRPFCRGAAPLPSDRFAAS